MTVINLFIFRFQLIQVLVNTRNNLKNKRLFRMFMPFWSCDASLAYRNTVWVFSCMNNIYSLNSMFPKYILKLCFLQKCILNKNVFQDWLQTQFGKTLNSFHLLMLVWYFFLFEIGCCSNHSMTPCYFQ